MKPSPKLSASNIPNGLREVSFEKKDTEGRELNLDTYFEITNGSISECIKYLKQQFADFQLVPIGGFSSGGGVFSNESSEKKTIGLIIAPPNALSERNNISYSVAEGEATFPLKTQELHINTKEKKVVVGAGVVLDQINASLQEALGKDFMVLGADLTSSGYASAGATFMTGGMGPSRISFADTVLAVSFFDGEESQSISGKENLDAIKETYGWTGIIESVTIPFIQIPKHSFGFALPINSSPEELGALAGYFAEKTTPIIKKGRLTNDALVTGLELISEDAFDLIEKNMPNLSGLSELKKNMAASEKKSAVLITGYAKVNPFEDATDALRIFIENRASGLALEQAMPFDNLQAMKNLREAAPDISRAQFLNEIFVYKDHTDINVMINLNKPAESMQAVHNCYARYQERTQNFIAQSEGIEGNVQVYGHLNPQGVNPHYRISLIAKTADQLDEAKEKAQANYKDLVQELGAVCIKMHCKLTGGEKGITSNQKIINALSKEGTQLPVELMNKFSKQKEAIIQANSIFNWRAKL